MKLKFTTITAVALLQLLSFSSCTSLMAQKTASALKKNGGKKPLYIKYILEVSKIAMVMALEI